MKVALLGKNGQLGWELLRTCPPATEVFAWSSAELDLCDPAAIESSLQAVGPAVVVNAAAYTAVDQAEQDKATAFAVNVEGARQVARIAKALHAYLVHVSTDFVFDGRKTIPYRPDDRPAPLGVYGASKRQGEEWVLSEHPGAAILRTSWLYSVHGRNFVKTMLKLMDSRDSLRVVADQVGSPTWARGLAEVIWRMVATKPVGIFHWSDDGMASWYDFAVAIQTEAIALGLLDRKIPILPVTTAEYPTPARRPAYSVLDKSALQAALGVTPESWRLMLNRMLREYAADVQGTDHLGA